MDSHQSKTEKNSDLDAVLANLEKQHKQKNLANNNLNNYSEQMTDKSLKNQDQLIDSFLSELNQQKSQSKNQNNHPNTDMELDNLRQQFQQPSTHNNVQQKSTNVEESVNNIAQKFQQNRHQNQSKSSQQSTVTAESLTSISQQFQQKQEQHKREQKTENLEIIRQQELEKQRQRKQLTHQAEIWLKNLDPYSDEGFWFEQFASSYPSKLEAAIEYLQALQ